ncbi:hypothetical protein [Pseudoruegeria sp. HB172150]|uniref:hypothetical protein n=1 Tax=Pseudoruegeria sp. HB172150 TaxID=2721164 RepID=UPI0015554429|nr:hypothetical protein [Pseudoruegeria sp. HB172150]
MRILESQITDMRYNADFGRVEAAVSLLVKPQAGQPPRSMRMRTSQPLEGSTPLEDRLKEDAIRLAQSLAEKRAHRPTLAA